MTSSDITLQLSPDAAPVSWRAHLAIILLFFIALAPTLTWLEFSSGSENLIVATALETRRTGHWLIPTMRGQPRIAKPPLAGIGAMLLVAAPRYLLVIARMRHETDLARFWYSEVTRAGASDLAGNPWYSHLGLFWMVLPWLLATLGFLTDSDGRSWYPSAWPALLATAAGIVILIRGIIASRRRPIAFVGATALAVLLVQGLFAFGYAHCETGRSELRPLAEAIHAANASGVVYCHTPGRRAPQDLSIYLNREVRDLADPGALPSEATIVVTMRGRKEPEHAVVAQWKELSTTQGEKHVWHAYAVRN